MNEDVKNLQSLALSTAEIFRESGLNFVISGCNVSGNSLTAGYVWLDGKVRQVAETDISTMQFPIYICTKDAESTTKMVYLDGSTGPQFFEYGTTVTDDSSLLTDSYIECESRGGGFPGLTSWLRNYALTKNDAAEDQTIDSLVTFNSGIETPKSVLAASFYGQTSSVESTSTATLDVSGKATLTEATVSTLNVEGQSTVGKINASYVAAETLYVSGNASMESLVVNEIGLAGRDLTNVLDNFESRIQYLEDKING